MLCKGRIAGVAWAASALWGAAVAGAVEAQGAPGEKGEPSSAIEASAHVKAPSLAVERAVLVGNGSMLQVHFSIPISTATQWIPMEPNATHVIDEATGERFFVENLVRIGPAAQTRLPRGASASYMVIDNRHEHLKAGAKITVVVGGLKQEHVTVVER
jgi:hypothetical protein